MAAKNARIEDDPPALAQASWFDPQMVLDDIRCFRSGIVADDLKTSALRVALTRA